VLGVVRGFYSLVDYSRFGQTCFRSYFPVGYKSGEEFRELIKGLSSSPHVIGIDECGGRWDIVLTLLAGNASRFNKILKDLIASNPSLKDFDVVTNVVTHDFGRKYLHGGAGGGVIIGGDRDPVQLSATDLAVIRETFSNPRKTSARVSSSVGVHPMTVRMLVKYRNITPERERELVRYCRDHPSAVSLNKVLGSWDIEIDIEAGPGEPMRSCVMGIRERFEDIIRETETIELFQNHKKVLITREALGD
jgi:DNA-binding Lrp family transcriptional regulator